MLDRREFSNQVAATKMVCSLPDLSIARTECTSQELALLLASPVFQRR